MMHSSTSRTAGNSSSTALIAYAPSCGEGVLLSPPRNRPIGVRFAARMTGKFDVCVAMRSMLRRARIIGFRDRSVGPISYHAGLPFYSISRLATPMPTAAPIIVGDNLRSLQSHILQEEHKHPGAKGDLTWILSAISLAGKTIANKVRRVGLEDVLGEH